MEPQTPQPNGTIQLPLPGAPTPVQPETPDVLTETFTPKPEGTPLDGLVAVEANPEVPDEDATRRRSYMHSLGDVLDATKGGDNFDDVMALMEQTRKVNEASIRSLGDNMLRQAAENEALNNEVEKAYNFNPEVPDEAAILARQARMASIQERANRTAKEESERKFAETIATLRASGDDVKAELMLMDKETPNAFDRYIDIEQTRASMMRAIEDAGVANKDRNWFLWATDALMFLLPVTDNLSREGTFTTNPSQQGFLDPVLSGGRFNTEVNNYWNAMLRSTSADERAEHQKTLVKMVGDNVNTWFGPNELLRNQILSEYLNTPSATYLDILNAVDLVTGLAPIAKTAVTTPFKITTALGKAGATAKLSKLVENFMLTASKEGVAAASAKYGMSFEELVAVVMPKPLNGTATVHASLAPGMTMLDRLKNGEKLYNDFIGDMAIIQRLSDGEKKVMMDDWAERLKRFALSPMSPNKRHVVGVDLETEIMAGSELNRGSAVLGRAFKNDNVLNNPWFKTHKAAMTELKKMGLTLDDTAGQGIAKIIPAPDGDTGFAIKFTFAVDETGQVLGGGRIVQGLTDKMKAGPFNLIARYIGSGKTSASEKLFGAALLSEGKKARIIAAVNKEITPSLYAITGTDRDLLGSLLSHAATEGKWANVDELRTIYATQNGVAADAEKFVAAYQAAVHINDLEYYLRNVEQVIKLSSEGFEKVTVRGLSTFNGKVYRILSEVPEETIYNVSTGSVHIQNPGATRVPGTMTRLSQKDLLDYQRKGHVIIRANEPIDVFVNGSKGRVKFLLVKGSDMKLNKLDMIQVPYIEGGHRMYSAKYFVKKMVTGKQPWGDEFLDSPFTPTAAMTKEEGAAWVKAVNEVQEVYRTAVKAGKIDDELDTIVQDALNARVGKGISMPPSVDFIAWMKKYGAEHPFEVVFDRELPSGYASARMKIPEQYWGEELSGIQTYMQTQGRMFLSGKGPILNNINDWEKPAEVLDPYRTLTNAMNQIARVGSIQDFKIKAIENWISTYGPALNLKGLESMNPARIFLEARFTSQNAAGMHEIIAAAELQRSVIKRMLGWQSEIDMSLQVAQRRLGEWVVGKVPTAGGKRLANNIGRWWEETNPIAAHMGLAYDMTLGLFNPRQWPLQIQTAFGAASIDTVKGAQAMAGIVPAYLMMRKGAADVAKELSIHIKNGWHKKVGFANPEDYRAMMMSMKQSGWTLNVLATMKNEAGPNAAMSMFKNGVDNARQASRFFVESAEEANRIVAWQMAWRMTKEKFPKLNVKSPLFIEKTQSLASTLSFNMDKASAAAWQKNVFTKIPTQFMSYMARWHEMLINPDLTAVQKFRLALGQGVMYGVNGLPIVAPIAAFAAAQTGDKPKMGTLEGIAYRGFWDTAIFAASGGSIDAAFSESAGIGMQPTDLVASIMGVGRYGKDSVADIAGGASLAIIGNFYGTLYKVLENSIIQMADPDRPPVLLEGSLQEFARSISTLNNAYKAYYILQYGNLTNRKGEVMMRDLPDQYALMAMLGISPEEFTKQTARMSWLGNRKDQVKTHTDFIGKFRQDWATAIKSGDYARADDVSQQIRHYRNVVVPAYLLDEVDRMVGMSKPEETVIQSVTERVIEMKQKDDMAKQREEASNNEGPQ